MSVPLFLSRARLRTGRGEQLSAIAPALLRGSKGDTVGNAHRILWMLFRDRDAEEPRDFLWREEAPGRYLILSKRPPSDERKLFDLQTKDFAPDLKAGDRLAFALRANPVITRKTVDARKREKLDGKGRLRGERSDIVMDALHDLPERLRDDERGESERAKQRADRTESAARTWIGKQGERHGFKLHVRSDENGKPYPIASNYDVVEIPRGKTDPGTGRWTLEHKRRFARFGVLDFEGLIEVTDPSLFLPQLAEGFGKAKAFGCGLMLIRRAV
jgi:CRISPR system Cascade subunit CasE